MDALVATAQTGSYQLSNPQDPTSPLSCLLNGGLHSYCPATGVNTFCYIWVQTAPITPAVSAPPATLAPYLAGVVGSIGGQAGQVGSVPSATGVVNTPVCFWIDNMGIPVESDLTLTVAGAPDPSRRRIYYTYLVRIQFLGVQWNFDDVSGGHEVQPPPECGVHPMLTAYEYPRISDDRNPDRRYHVVATERYAITAEMFWFDANGGHAQAADPGVSIPAISPPAHPQYVGQVEGIPIGG